VPGRVARNRAVCQRAMVSPAGHDRGLVARDRAIVQRAISSPTTSASFVATE
jgi:hypothetical protein